MKLVLIDHQTGREVELNKAERWEFTPNWGKAELPNERLSRYARTLDDVCLSLDLDFDQDFYRVFGLPLPRRTNPVRRAKRRARKRKLRRR